MKSVIMQVDESTKGLMEEIQSGISASIEDGIRGVKSTVETVGDNTDIILRKFKNFDGVSSSIEQLRSLVDESKKFAEMVTPIQDSIADVKEESALNGEILSSQGRSINSIIESVQRLEEKQSATNTDLQNAIVQLETHYASLTEQQSQNIIEELRSKVSSAQAASHEEFSNVQTTITDVKTAIDSVQDNITNGTLKLETSIAQIAVAQRGFLTSYTANEAVHAEFESNARAELKQLVDSVEKLQSTLDILVNLVTPFWKKWNKRN